MSDRQYFIDGVQIHETGDRQWFMGGVQIDESAAPSTPANGQVATFDCSDADGTIEATVYTSSETADPFGVVFRLSDANNYWLFSLDADDNAWGLWKYESGSWSVVDSGTTTVAASTNYTLKVVLSGSTVTCYVDDSQVYTGTQTFNQSSTKHGLYLSSSDQACKDITFDGVASGGTTSLTCESGTYALAGHDASITVSQSLTCGSGSYTLTGNDSSLSVQRTLACATGTYTLTGNDVDLTVAQTMSLGSGLYSLTGNDLAFSRSFVLTADSGSYTLTGNNVGLAASLLVSLDTGTYTLTGHDVAMGTTAALVAETGSYAVTGQAVGLIISRHCTLVSGSYTLTGNSISMRYSGESVVPQATETRFERVFDGSESRPLRVPVDSDESRYVRSLV